MSSSDLKQVYPEITNDTKRKRAIAHLQDISRAIKTRCIIHVITNNSKLRTDVFPLVNF